MPPRVSSGKGAKPPRGTGAQAVYERLRREIIDLDFEPGALLDETDLSQRYAVSRSPIREALIRLSAEGLVQTLRNRSSVVASFDLSEVLGFFDALDLMYRTTARLAALSASPQSLEQIREAQAAHAQAIASGDAYRVMSLNADFHLAVARAGGNPYFESWTRNVLVSGQRIIRLYMRHYKDKPREEMRGEHECIVQAIERGDAIMAEAAAGRDAAILADEMLEMLKTRKTEGLSPTGKPRRVV